MAFDDFVQGFNEPKKQVPEIVGKTLDMGLAMIKNDYLPMLMKSDFKEYVKEEKEMNLYKRGWRFQFGASRSWAGLCSPVPTNVLKSKNKNILVSIDFVKGDDNWKDNCKDVILHEISHAIVDEIFLLENSKFTTSELKKLDPAHFLKAGHGDMFTLVCKSINEEGVCSQFYENANKNKFFKPYMYSCVNCGNKEYGNTKSFVQKCSKCLMPVMIEGNV